MNRIERLRYRLRMIRLALRIQPMAGGDDGDGGSGDGGDASGTGEGGEGQPASGDGTTGQESGGQGTGTQEGGEGSSEDDDSLNLQRAKAKITKANKEAESLRKRLKQYEDANKSEQDKLSERATTAEKEAQEAKTSASRLKIALKKGLTETQAKRLVGETEEELEADADELLASFRDDDSGQESRRRPQERLRPGGAPSAEPEEDDDPEKLAAKVQDF